MITMDAFSAYKIYMGLKAHFNSDYDFKKYSGKTTASKSSYLKRKDKFFFGDIIFLPFLDLKKAAKATGIFLNKI